jgi:hypothetical protein
MSTTVTKSGRTGTRPGTGQKVGLVIAALYSLGNIPSAFMPTPDGETGPPLFILAIDTVLGVVGLVAVVAAWRGSALGARIAAGSIILITLTALPAFFVSGVPAAIRVLVGASVLVTVLAVYLMLAPRRDRSFAGGRS